MQAPDWEATLSRRVPSSLQEQQQRAQRWVGPARAAVLTCRSRQDGLVPRKVTHARQTTIRLQRNEMGQAHDARTSPEQHLRRTAAQMQSVSSWQAHSHLQACCMFAASNVGQPISCRSLPA